MNTEKTMTIETKFNEEDVVFFISPLKKVVSSIVRGFKIERKKGQTEILYLCNEDNDARVHLTIPESEVFPTKEALLASL